METMRAQMERNAHHLKVVKRVQLLDLLLGYFRPQILSLFIFPTVADLCLVNEIKERLLSQTLGDLVPDNILACPLGSYLLEKLPSFFSLWQASVVSFLVSKLPNAILRPSSPYEICVEESTLGLAGCWFICHLCEKQDPSNGTYQAHNLIAHKCTHTHWHYDNWANPDLPDALREAFTHANYTIPWTLTSIVDRPPVLFSLEAHATVRDIAQSCGLDPETATVGDLDAIKMNIVCVGREESVQTTMWREAVSNGLLCIAVSSRSCINRFDIVCVCALIAFSTFRLELWWKGQTSGTLTSSIFLLVLYLFSLFIRVAILLMLLYLTCCISTVCQNCYGYSAMLASFWNHQSRGAWVAPDFLRPSAGLTNPSTCSAETQLIQTNMNQLKDGPVTLTTLPDDLLFQILQWLSVADLLSVRGVGTHVQS